MDVHERIAKEYREAFELDGFGREQERSRILKALLAHEDHVSAHELAKELSINGVAPSETFIEQVLEQFVHYGLCAPIRGENGRARYEHVHIGRHHDHIICVSCGRIMEVECPLDDRVERLSKMTGYQAVHTHLQIHGICPTCAEARPTRFTLDQVAAGEKVRVVEMGGGSEMQQRLTSMGLRIGSEIRRQNTNWFGPIIVSIGTTRLAIGRGMAKRVFVEKTDAA